MSALNSPRRADGPGGEARQAKRDRPGPRSYAGVPVVHRAHWKWLVIAYFFLGGIAGGAQAIAAVAALVGGKPARRVARTARYVSFAAFLPCPALLILDLGRPERFLRMLRVLKLRSPMSIGTWCLLLFGGAATATAAAQAVEDCLLPDAVRPLTRRLPAPALDAFAGGLGLLLAGYTGVLLGATAVPLWARRAMVLGPLFLSSALSTAAAAISLSRAAFGRGHDPDLAKFEQAAALVESSLLLTWLAGLGGSGRPLHTGRLGFASRHGVAGGGLFAPLLLNAAAFTFARVRRPLAIGAAILTLAGGFLLRYLVIVAGHASADDPEATFEMTRRR